MRNLILRRSALLTVFAAAAFALTACDPSVNKPAVPNASPSPAATGSPVASPAVSPTAGDKTGANKADALVGRWPGVEGTYLDVAKKGDKYTIEIKNLDGVKTYEGTAKGDVIEFTRDGKTETIKAATAEETGMKWLAGEKNCVVIQKGSEGFCKK